MLEFFIAKSVSYPKVGDCTDYRKFSPGEFNIAPATPLCLIGQNFYAYYIDSPEPVKIIGANGKSGEIFGEKEDAFIFTSERNKDSTVPSLFQISTQKPQKIKILGAIISSLVLDTQGIQMIYYKSFAVLKSNIDVEALAYIKKDGFLSDTLISTLAIFNPNSFNCNLEYNSTATVVLDNNEIKDVFNIKGESASLKTQFYDNTDYSLRKTQAYDDVQMTSLKVKGKADSTAKPVEECIFEITAGAVYSHQDDNENLYPAGEYVIDYSPKIVPTPTVDPSSTGNPSSTGDHSPKDDHANEGEVKESNSETIALAIVGTISSIIIVAVVSFFVYWFVFRKTDDESSTVQNILV